MWYSYESDYALIIIVIVLLPFTGGCHLFGDLPEYDVSSSTDAGPDASNDEDEIVVEIDSSWNQLVEVSTDGDFETTAEVLIDADCQPQGCELTECTFTIAGVETTFEPCESPITETVNRATEWELIATAERNGRTEEAEESGRLHLEPFRTRWQPDPDSSLLELPLVPIGVYDFIAVITSTGADSSGAEQTVHITSHSEGDIELEDSLQHEEFLHVDIQGRLTGWSFAHPDVSADPLSLLEVQQWGAMQWGQDLSGHFRGAQHLEITADDRPRISAITSLSESFQGTEQLESIPGINSWDTSSVTDMSSMFQESVFDSEISGWDTSSVTDMSFMFADNSSFNQDLSSWETSSVTDMEAMFHGAESFDHPLTGWDITSVTSMENMLAGGQLSPTHYDATLVSWREQEVQPEVTFHAGESTIDDPAGDNARDVLVEQFCWHIHDGNGDHAPHDC